jgi:hypothetical protein
VLTVAIGDIENGFNVSTNGTESEFNSDMKF